MSTNDARISKLPLVPFLVAFVIATIAVAAVFAAKTGFFRPKPIATLRVGYLPVTGHAKFFIAKEEGFFKDEGLDVQLVEFANSADGLAALRADKLDLGAFGTTAPLVHIA